MAASKGASGSAAPAGRRHGAAANGEEVPLPSDRREAIASVGAQLRERRMAAGLSLRQFARDLGVSPSFISQIENAKSQPSVATLYAICNTLDVSIDELFGNTGPAEPQPAPPVERDAGAATGAAGKENNHSFHDALAKLDELSANRESPVVRPSQRRRLVLDSGVTWEQLSAVHESAVDFLFVRYDVGGSSVPGEKLTRHGGIEYGYIISGTLEVALGFESYQVRAGESISFDSATPHRLTNNGDVPVEAIWFVHGRNTSHEH